MTLSSTAESAEKYMAILSALRGKWIGGVAVLAGLLIAFLPVRYSLALFGGGALLFAALLEPLVGLALMLILGLAEPLLGAAGLLPFPIGQAGVGLFAAAWLVRGLIHRRIYWPSIPITIPFFLYLAACALSVFVTQPPSPRDTFTELLKWGEMYLIAGIVFEAAGRKKLGWALGVLLVVGLLQAGIGIWQFQFRGHGPEAFIILGDHYRAYGTLEQPNPFGGFMGIVWPVAAVLTLHFGFTIIQHWWSNRTTPDPRPQQYQRSSAFNLRNLHSLVPAFLVATVALTALLVSFSRGAWLGAGAAGLTMAVFWPRRWWLGIGLAGLGLIGLFALYNFGLLPSFIAARFADVGDFIQVYDVRGVHINDSNFSIVERLAHWQAAFRMADAHPFTGVGFGNYEYAYPDYRLINWQYGLGHAHNIYLNVLAETGAIGLAAYLLMWGWIVALTIKVISRPNQSGLDRAIAIGLLGSWAHLATHQFLDNLYVGNIPFYIGGLLGVLCIIATRAKPQPSNLQFSNL